MNSIDREKILEELNNSVNAFSYGAKTREDIEKQIDYYEKQYNFEGRDEIIKRINDIEASSDIVKEHKEIRLRLDEERKNKGKQINTIEGNKKEEISDESSALFIKIMGIVAIIIIIIVVVESIIGGSNKTNLKEDATNTENKTIHHEKRWDSDDDGLSDDFEDEIGTDPNEYTWNDEWN